ncbi:protein G12-like [Andrena cerasifolii]|uniref:protein G12-like n=1 Tax=Andrena cerasifolii TaxID=2819439 RepID=UPI004037D4D1
MQVVYKSKGKLVEASISSSSNTSETCSIARNTKMKFAVALLAVLALAGPLSAAKLPASGSGALAKEMQDLVDLVPFEKIIPIIKAYAVQDKEVQTALKVLQSSELKLFVSDVEANPAVKHLLKYIQNAGLDIISMINKLNDILGLGHISALDELDLKISGGIAGLGKDILAVVPIQKIEQAFEEKRKNSKVFNALIHEMLKPELVKVYLSLHSNKHYVKLVLEADQAKIPAEIFTGRLPLLMMSKTILALNA